MKFRILAIMALIAMILPQAGMAQTDELIAFPGCEGYGRITSGGRGGAVYHVTRLDDDNDEGSFRWACNKSGARTIVFDVSGTIYLKSELKLKNANVTIAGQTAPGDGICIADYPFVISAPNVIIRYVRFRLGNRNVANHEGDGLGGMDGNRIVIDHCTISWSIDECLSVYGSKNITCQWNIISQSLYKSGHSKGTHGYGGNWGGSGASYHHNYLCHHSSRAPRLGPRPGTQKDERMDLRNNVIYNWGGEGCYGGEGMNVNIVNNYYMPGALTASGTKGMRIAAPGIRTSEYTKHNTSTPNDWDKMWHVWGKYYVEGNVNTRYPQVTKDNWTYGVYNQIDNSKNDGTYTQATKDTMRINEPIHFEPTTTHTAEVAFKRVLDYAGASLHRDIHDQIMVSDARDSVITYTSSWTTAAGNTFYESPGLLDNQDHCVYPDGTSGWPVLNSEEPLTDTDRDGMPDMWELQNGLDPNDPEDRNLTDAVGYTMLELYINGLVDHITKAQNEGGVLLSGQSIFAPAGIEEINYDSLQRPADDRIFNLMGVEMDPEADLAPGIYIRNGRKFIIR